MARECTVSLTCEINPAPSLFAGLVHSLTANKHAGTRPVDPPSTLNAAILLAGGSGVVLALCLRLIGGRDILTVRSFLFFGYAPKPF